MENSAIVHIIPFEEANITKHEQTQSQTFIRISSTNFSDMIIGERCHSSFWETQKNKINTSKNCTNYFMKTNKEWFRLSEALKHFL